MKVKRPLSGYYQMEVCDLCQSALDTSPYLPRKCHYCGRELCKACAQWRYYRDGLEGDLRWVAYCAECDARLAGGEESDASERDLHRLYREVQELGEAREAALERFDEQARELRAKIHATAGTLGKSLGRFGL